MAKALKATAPIAVAPTVTHLARSRFGADAGAATGSGAVTASTTGSAAFGLDDLGRLAMAGLDQARAGAGRGVRRTIAANAYPSDYTARISVIRARRRIVFG